MLRHLCGNLPVCFSWKTKHIRSAHKFSYPLSYVIHGSPRERFSFNQSNRSPRLTCFTHTIEASLNNLRKFLRFFLLLKATTVGNEFSVSGAKNPSPVIFVTRDLKILRRSRQRVREFLNTKQYAREKNILAEKRDSRRHSSFSLKVVVADIQQLINEAEYLMRNYGDRGGCHPSKP